MRRGKLIVLDGVDGSGKTTQGRLLLRRLQKEGYSARFLSFPQYKENVFGRLIREFLDGRHGDPTKTDPYLSAALYAADRFETKTKLEGWLAKGTIVICDRYVSANKMHQGGKISSPKERARFFSWLQKIEYGIFKLPRPTATLYLSLSPVLAMALLSRKDHVERSTRYNRASFKTGKELAKKEGWITISCELRGRVLSREAVHEKIYTAVRKFL